MLVYFFGIIPFRTSSTLCVRYEITGITEENLRDAMPLNEVRQRILQILYNGESISRARLNGGRANVLVGHNLAHHLDCLVMAYPDRLLR